MCKRDVAGAFSLLYLRPDMRAFLATDFPAGDLGFETDVTMSHSVLPFGWMASPSFYQNFAESVSLHHANLGPPNPRWGGFGNFRQFTFVGDSVFIESQIGNRPDINFGCWEACLKLRAGDSSVNKDKLRLEEKWCTGLSLTPCSTWCLFLSRRS